MSAQREIRDWRRIATLPGYNFSPALKNLDIVWTPETVAKLFELGPATFTPGTKMPEQRIGSAEDRAALVQLLEKATKSPGRTKRNPGIPHVAALMRVIAAPKCSFWRS